MQLASAPRESSGQNDRLLMAVQAAPAPAGGSRRCHGFCQRENEQNNIIILHRTTSAKTRATATLRQLHIPPNVSNNSVNFQSRGLVLESVNWGASISSRCEETRHRAVT